MHRCGTSRARLQYFAKGRGNGRMRLKLHLYESQNYRCNACQLELPERNLTFDHIHPQAKGGVTLRENLQLLCHACNVDKADGTQEALIRRLKREDAIHETPARDTIYESSMYGPYHY